MHFFFQPKGLFRVYSMRGPGTGNTGHAQRLTQLKGNHAMTKLNANSDNPQSSPAKRGGWWRFFLWAALAGGVVFILLLVALIALTVPNLRREVAPPEVSGAHRVAQPKNSPDRPAVPTSGTLSVSVPTSGTQPLNLADVPHLAPTMRKKPQEGLDRGAEPDRALAAIADPVLRAQAAELLKDRRNMCPFLNLPLEWENLSFEEAHNHVWEWHHWEEGQIKVLPLHPYHLTLEESERERARGLVKPSPFLETCPEFYRAFSKEISYLPCAFERMDFELRVNKNDWKKAAWDCTWAHVYCPPDPNAPFLYGPPPSEEWRKQYEEWTILNRWRSSEYQKTYTWEEEVYCLRQMGLEGVPLLTVGSCQRALYKGAPNLQSPTYKKLQGFGEWARKKFSGIE